MEDEKIQAFKAMFGQAGEDALKEVLGQIQATQKAADAAGMAYKEAPEAGALTIAATETVGSNAGEASFTLTARDVANIVTAPNTNANTLGATVEEEDEPEDERVYAGDLEPGELVNLLSAGVAQAIAPLMGGVVEQMKAFMGTARKDDEIALIQEQQARKAQEDAQARATIQQQMTALETALKEAKEKLAELTGEQPRAAQGYRASQAPDTAINAGHALKAQQPVGIDPNFLNGMMGGANNETPPGW